MPMLDTGIQAIEGSVTKALTQFGSSFELEDFTPQVVERGPVTPQFLTTLLTGIDREDFMTSNTYKYDAMTRTSVLPSGKQFTGFGPRANKDKPKTYRWGIPSFGISGNVEVADYANKRQVGTENTVDSEMIHLERLDRKMAEAWDLFNEQQLLTLLTTDTNDVAGGPFDEYNFYTEIVGGSRAVADIDFSDDTVDQMEQLRAQKKLLKEEAIRAGEINSKIIVLCGSNFFKEVLTIEKNEGLARDLKGTYDFASQEVTSDTIGTQTFEVDNFVSELCGLHFFDHTMDIGGVSIGADDAYMIPVGAEQFIRKAYAPAMTREYANTEALSAYSWVNIDDRNGITRWEESNFLMSLVNPRLIRKMTVA